MCQLLHNPVERNQQQLQQLHVVAAYFLLVDTIQLLLISCQQILSSYCLFLASRHYLFTAYFLQEETIQLLCIHVTRYYLVNIQQAGTCTRRPLQAPLPFVPYSPVLFLTVPWCRIFFLFFFNERISLNLSMCSEHEGNVGYFHRKNTIARYQVISPTSYITHQSYQLLVISATGYITRCPIISSNV